MGGECATATFDRAGRIVTVCVGVDGPRLAMFDPQTLDLLTVFPLPPRIPSPAQGGNPFTDFSGGGYFYLDNEDRVVIPTTTRHIWVIGQTANEAGPLFQLEHDYDVSAAVPAGDGIISAMPDWAGHIWFVSGGGVIGIVDPPTGVVRSVALGERIGNSFAVDETGGVYIVTDAAMYRFDCGPDGWPLAELARALRQHRHQEAGPDAGGLRHDAHAARPGVRRDHRQRRPDEHRRLPAGEAGERAAEWSARIPSSSSAQGATDQSLIGADRVDRRREQLRLHRPDVGDERRHDDARLRAGRHQGRPERLPDGLAEHRPRRRRRWSRSSRWRTASSTRTRSRRTRTAPTPGTSPRSTSATATMVYKRLAGTGLGFNNNFAPVSLGPDGTAYVGALGGLVMLRDR